MNRKLALILIALLAVLSFAGCNKEETATEQENMAENGQSSTQTEDNEPGVTETEENEAPADVEKISKKDARTIEKMIQKGNELESYSYTTKLKIGSGEMDTKMKAYISKDWMRMEMEMPNSGTAVVLMNLADGKVYTIMDAQKRVLVMGNSEMVNASSAGFLETMLEAGFISAGAELENADYKGKKALFLSFSGLDTEIGKNVSSKIWYDEDKGLPLAYEITVEGEETILSEFEYDFSKPSKELFELPKGYEVIEMGEMLEETDVPTEN